MTRPPFNWETRNMPVQNHHILLKETKKRFTLLTEDAVAPE